VAGLVVEDENTSTTLRYRRWNVGPPTTNYDTGALSIADKPARGRARAVV